MFYLFQVRNQCLLLQHLYTTDNCAVCRRIKGLVVLNHLATQKVEQLRALRKELADERMVPAYVVFNDATLRQMAAAQPRTEAEFLSLSGVGAKKLESYGEVFLDAIARWQSQA